VLNVENGIYLQSLSCNNGFHGLVIMVFPAYGRGWAVSPLIAVKTKKAMAHVVAGKAHFFCLLVIFLIG